MRTGFTILVAFLVTAPAFAGIKPPTAKSQPFQLNRASVHLTVSADGTPSGISCAPGSVAEICGMLSRAVPSWKFAPGHRAGVAVDMAISLTLSLVAVPKPGGFGLQATYAWVNPRPPSIGSNAAFETRKSNPPRYPPEFMRRGIAGTVILEMWVQPGSEYPRIGKMWFEGKSADRKNAFVAATLDAAAKWKVETTTPEQLSFCVPVEYSLGGPARPPKGFAPCEPTYAEGFAPPQLLTDVTTATL